jgi:hypothetical protein
VKTCFFIDLFLCFSFAEIAFFEQTCRVWSAVCVSVRVMVHSSFFFSKSFFLSARIDPKFLAVFCSKGKTVLTKLAVVHSYTRDCAIRFSVDHPWGGFSNYFV